MTIFATGPNAADPAAEPPADRQPRRDRRPHHPRLPGDEGIATVAVYADSDRDAIFVRMADQAHALGGDRPTDTYLDGAKIIAIAQAAGADAIHPGCRAFVRTRRFRAGVADAGLIWSA